MNINQVQKMPLQDFQINEHTTTRLFQLNDDCPGGTEHNYKIIKIKTDTL